MDWKDYYAVDDPATSNYLFENHFREWGSKFGTPFEHRMIGGTPGNWKLLEERGDTVDDYHIPMLVLDGSHSIEEANFVRKTIGYLALGAHSYGFTDLDGKFLAVSLEELDPETGQTVKDPRILGIWNPVDKSIQEVPGRDLNREYYQMLKDMAEAKTNNDLLWNYVRDGKSYLETESSGEPEKG